MRYYIIAGERSGDLHGSNLVRHLSQMDQQAEFRGVGGKRMQNENVVITKNSNELSFMGFWEVIKHLRKIFKAFRFLHRDIKQYHPDAIILIDFPGFNLRIAKWAKKKGYKVIYYISPQVWAWKSERVLQIEAYTDKLITILPFEQQFYAQHGLSVEKVPHPSVEEINKEKTSPADIAVTNISDKPIIALLPGSRKQEIKHTLSIMSSVAKYFPDYQFVVAGVSEIKLDYYEKHIATDWIKVVHDKTYDLLKVATAAIVTSGTATLETALFNVPQVVCYKGNRFSYYMAKRMVEVEYISLVNLILDQPLVKELIQNDLTEVNLKDELAKILPGSKKRAAIEEGYAEMQKRLGNESGSEEAAKLIYDSFES
ncbi:MAG: lipid-A-disaccharide synthase [Bacteroidetes bacterium]|nr:lipid-A-disaccharide synthase [Bacteroidota bacterium]